MKAQNACIIAFVFAASLSFVSAQDEAQKCLLSEGETIMFSNKPLSPTQGSAMNMKKGSYDGTAYHLSIDASGAIELKNISHADGKKQDELLLAGCTGSATRGGETVTIKLEKCRKGYYLVDFDRAKLAGEYDSIVRITLSVEDEAGKPAAFYSHEKDDSGVHIRRKMNADGTSVEDASKEIVKRTHSFLHLVAVPPGIMKKDMYAATHPARSLAHFSKIEIELKGGKVMTFPRGSYILCEGNKFTLK